MLRHLRFRRILASALAVAVVGLLAAVALPHSHDASGLSHAAQACRLCKIHDQAGAAVIEPAPLAVAPRLSAAEIRPTATAPRAAVFDPAHPVRSPPYAS